MTASLVLITLIGLAVLAAARLSSELTRAADERRRLEGSWHDPETGTFGAASVRSTLAPELRFAAESSVSAALAVFRLHCADPTEALARMSRAARAHETVFRPTESEAAVLLWDVDLDRAIRATNRLGGALLGAQGLHVVDAGLAMVPYDGDDVEAVLAVARSRSRAVQDFGSYSESVPFVA